MWYGESLRTFRMNVMPPLSGSTMSMEYISCTEDNNYIDQWYSNRVVFIYFYNIQLEFLFSIPSLGMLRVDLFSA
jgi:hypothetical protein